MTHEVRAVDAVAPRGHGACLGKAVIGRRDPPHNIQFGNLVQGLDSHPRLKLFPVRVDDLDVGAQIPELLQGAVIGVGQVDVDLDVAGRIEPNRIIRFIR